MLLSNQLSELCAAGPISLTNMKLNSLDLVRNLSGQLGITGQ